MSNIFLPDNHRALSAERFHHQALSMTYEARACQSFLIWDKREAHESGEERDWALAVGTKGTKTVGGLACGIQREGARLAHGNTV